jgi:hypothetical protein
MALMATAMMLMELVYKSTHKYADIHTRLYNRWWGDSNLNI